MVSANGVYSFAVLKCSYVPGTCTENWGASLHWPIAILLYLLLQQTHAFATQNV